MTAWWARWPRWTTTLGTLGAGLAVGASTALEAWVGPLAPGAWAAQALLAGALALTLRLLLGRLGPARAGQGTVIGLAWFASLVPIRHLNVEVLPSTHFLAPRSLLLDAAVLAAASLLGWAAHRQAARAPGIRVLAAVLALPLLLACALTVEREWPRDRPTPRGRHAAGPDLLLVVVDSARSDHLGIHGYPRPTSPSLDALATGARVYEDAWSASSWTLPTMLEVLRGSATESLPATLARQGYVTACFTDNPHLRPATLVTEGFDIVQGSTASWRRLLRGSSLGAVLERLLPPDDRRLVDRALSWVSTVPGPIFLYVHLMDSHAPFRFPAIDGVSRPGRRIEFPQTGMTLSAEEAADIVARYDGGLRSADREVGRLFAALRARGPLLALITADHGESLGEGTRWFHGQTLAPELLRVPLLALGEGVQPGRVAGVVGQAGLAPTLLAAAGVRPADAVLDLRTSSGMPVVEGQLPPRLSYRIADGHRLVVDHATGRRSLYRLEDAGEEQDLAATLPELATRLAAGLAPPRPLPREPASPEAAERLRALGYVHQ